MAAPAQIRPKDYQIIAFFAIEPEAGITTNRDI